MNDFSRRDVFKPGTDALAADKPLTSTPRYQDLLGRDLRNTDSIKQSMYVVNFDMLTIKADKHLEGKS